MADTKLSDLTELTTDPNALDEFYIRDESELPVSESKRILFSTLKTAVLNNITSLNIDQINITGNNISTNLTNADLQLTPQGTGFIQLRNISIDSDNNFSGHGAQINAQTGTTYTILGTDNGKVVTLDNASAITLTLPQTTTETIAQGFQCAIIQKGAGQVTVVKEGTDTILSKNSNLKLAAQGVAATIIKTTAGSPNAWFLGGDLSA